MAAPEKKAEAPKKPGYEMPRPPMGLVHWFNAPGVEPTPAIVTGIGRSAIAVALVPTDSRVVLPKDGVMHVSDPRAKTAANPESGFWDFTPEHKALMKLIGIVEADAK
jgi:hypothetical protein